MQSKRFDEFVSGFYVPEGGQSVVAASGEGTIQVSSKGVGCYRNQGNVLRVRIRLNPDPRVFFRSICSGKKNFLLYFAALI
jgi:hypothetical protein